MQDIEKKSSEFRVSATRFSERIQELDTKLKIRFGKTDLRSKFPLNGKYFTLHWTGAYGPWGLWITGSFKPGESSARHISECSLEIKNAAVHKIPELIQQFRVLRTLDLQMINDAHKALDEVVELIENDTEGE